MFYPGQQDLISHNMNQQTYGGGGPLTPRGRFQRQQGAWDQYHQNRGVTPPQTTPIGGGFSTISGPGTPGYVATPPFSPALPTPERPLSGPGTPGYVDIQNPGSSPPPVPAGAGPGSFGNQPLSPFFMGPNDPRIAAILSTPGLPGSQAPENPPPPSDQVELGGQGGMPEDTTEQGLMGAPPDREQVLALIKRLLAQRFGGGLPQGTINY